MTLRTPKLYQKILNKFSVREFSNWKGHKSLSVRDRESKGSLETYVLSAELEQFEELKAKIFDAGLKKEPIRIKFIKRFSKKFINEIL